MTTFLGIPRALAPPVLVGAKVHIERENFQHFRGYLVHVLGKITHPLNEELSDVLFLDLPVLQS